MHAFIPHFPVLNFPRRATRYIRGEIPKLPWCETQVNLETIAIVDQLVRMNAALMLTINSQPRVNAAPSADPAVGWGGAGGYVFQKVLVPQRESDKIIENMEIYRLIVERLAVLEYASLSLSLLLL